MVQTLDPATGGVARAVASLSNALVALGHTVELVTLDPTDSTWDQVVTAPVHKLGVGRTNYRYSSTLLPWLRRNRERFDVAIVNGLWQYISFAAWRAFAGTGTAYVVYPHGMLDPWFKRTFPLKHVKKWLYWPWAEYRLLRDAAAVIFTSEEERLRARESFWLYRCREQVSPLGIESPDNAHDEARAKFLEKFPAVSGGRFLLFLGRIHPKKGCDILLEAFAGADAATKLVIAGPDQTGRQTELQSQAARLGVADRVEFTGMLEGALKAGAFAAADAFVLPSHQENFGLSVVEALAAGLPVLISNRVNIWREIEEAGAGFVAPDDLAGTRDLLARWHACDDETRDAMRARARQLFQQRFTVERAANSLVEVLNAAVRR